MQATLQKKEQDLLRWQQHIHAIAEDRDEQAFAHLFDDFAPKLKAFSLAAQPGANMVADELVQEVMLKIWNKAHLYNPTKASVTTWLYTLARNARIDYLRKNGRFASEITADDIFHDILDESPDLFSLTQQKQTEQHIRESMKSLPEDQSLVLSKVYMEGKTHQQTAEELHLPLGTVKSRVRLALNKLEVLLGRNHEK
jgi:RNA polymerase sigma-70 factor (ECF subfamily)